MINFVKNIKRRNIILFSDLLGIASNKKKINHLINEFLKILKALIKNKNTIILPTYNLRFPHLKTTGKNTKFVTTGYLIKLLLKKFNFYRTKKPMYNYAVLGPNSKKILKLKQTTAWGDNSVIGYLSKQEDTIGIGINTNLRTFTWVTIHACEEKLRVPYRFWKIFKGKNLDTRKNVSEKMFVKDLEKQEINLKPKIVINKLLKSGHLFLKKGKKANYSIIYLNKYYKENLIHIKKIIK